jgi:hypothetical protein
MDGNNFIMDIWHGQAQEWAPDGFDLEIYETPNIFLHNGIMDKQSLMVF